MVRYDAAIIGAGGEGLAASIALAEAGLSTVVVERNVSTGGRLSSREFHPGFFASPFTDAIPHVPAQAFHALRLARHGIAMMPLTNIAIAPDYAPQLASKALLDEIREVQDALLARAGAEALELQP
ncbi:MAG: NAD(P)-binding protein, partial [Alphaproteobacteria bacterium]|nr:NAD(P)-binding protein [Alphaproteobacteria bacterium]